MINKQNQQANKEKRVMLINWKWEHLTLISNANAQMALDSGFGTKKSASQELFFWDYVAAVSEYASEAYIVRTRIECEQESKNVLLRLIDHIAEIFTDSSVFLFLHRGEHYANQDIDDILREKNSKVARCFFMEDGRDYIYFNRVRGTGLVNDIGKFVNIERVRGEKVIVYDEQNKQILAPYFDEVWHYYYFSFRKAVCNLKQDFFDFSVEYLMPHQPDEFSGSEFRNKLTNASNQKPYIFYRLKSFWGEYDQLYKKSVNNSDEARHLSILTREREAVEKLEREKRKSYLFDDCNSNMKYLISNEGKKCAQEHYQELNKKICYLLSEETETLYQKDFIDLRDLFRKLIECLPGYEV